MKGKTKKNVFTIIVSGLLVMGVLLSIFPLNLPYFQDLPNYTSHLILIYLILGTVFLIASNNKLLLLCFLGAGVLSLFLKTFSAENKGLSQRNTGRAISVANYNLINLEGDLAEFIEALQESETDVMCFHEVDPGWEGLLTRSLSNEFPNQAKLTRLDGLGKLALSKLPILDIDTFYFKDIPSLDLRLDIHGREGRLILTQIVPPFRIQKRLTSSDQLASLSQYINQIGLPVILAGEFNQVYWSREMRNLVERTMLLNSRRFIATLGAKVPHEHIFHSQEFDCLGVREIQDGEEAHIGVEGDFTFNEMIDFSGRALNSRTKN